MKVRFPIGTHLFYIKCAAAQLSAVVRALRSLVSGLSAGPACRSRVNLLKMTIFFAAATLCAFLPAAARARKAAGRKKMPKKCRKSTTYGNFYYLC